MIDVVNDKLQLPHLATKQVLDQLISLTLSEYQCSRRIGPKHYLVYVKALANDQSYSEVNIYVILIYMLRLLILMRPEASIQTLI